MIYTVMVQAENALDQEIVDMLKKTRHIHYRGSFMEESFTAVETPIAILRSVNSLVVTGEKK